MATDWKTLTPILEADRAAGLSMQAIADKHGVNIGSVSRALKPKMQVQGASDTSLQGLQPRTDSPQGQTETLDGSARKAGSQAPISPSDTPEDEGIDRVTARRLWNQAMRGEVKLDTVRAGLIKAALGKELEPETEDNPYTGAPEEELVEKCLVLACSVMTPRRVVNRLRKMMAEEPAMLDLLGEEDAIPQEARELDSPQVAGEEAEPSIDDGVHSEATPSISRVVVAGEKKNGVVEVETLME